MYGMKLIVNFNVMNLAAIQLKFRKSKFAWTKFGQMKMQLLIYNLHIIQRLIIEFNLINLYIYI